jgi:hypothetical protein
MDDNDNEVDADEAPFFTAGKLFGQAFSYSHKYLMDFRRWQD